MKNVFVQKRLLKNLKHVVWSQGYVVGNKAKWRISKRVFQENKAQKFGVLCFFETPVLRFAILPYYR